LLDEIEQAGVFWRRCLKLVHQGVCSLAHIFYRFRQRSEIGLPPGGTMVKYDFLDAERVRKAHSVKQISPLLQSLATWLTRIPDLRYDKIFPDRIAA
jgi:hypothetical protein